MREQHPLRMIDPASCLERAGRQSMPGARRTVQRLQTRISRAQQALFPAQMAPDCSAQL